MNNLTFNLSKSMENKEGPTFWGWTEEDHRPHYFTVYEDFYKTLLEENDGDYTAADVAAIGYALRTRGYDTTNLIIKVEGETIYEN